MKKLLLLSILSAILVGCDSKDQPHDTPIFKIRLLDSRGITIQEWKTYQQPQGYGGYWSFPDADNDNKQVSISGTVISEQK